MVAPRHPLLALVHRVEHVVSIAPGVLHHARALLLLEHFHASSFSLLEMASDAEMDDAVDARVEEQRLQFRRDVRLAVVESFFATFAALLHKVELDIERFAALRRRSRADALCAVSKRTSSASSPIATRPISWPISSLRSPTSAR